ncbi:MAG TPA: hypothetical protein VK447_02345, partial [Myxococcaceae bacterium]|nr:hypothetical protein [Myxococcaceae bacterium]
MAPRRAPRRRASVPPAPPLPLQPTAPSPGAALANTLASAPPPEAARVPAPGAQPATARLAYAAVAALDLDGDGRLTGRDEERARSGARAFTVELPLESGVTLRLSGAERLAHAADVLAEEVLGGRGDSASLPLDRLLQPRTRIMREMLDRGWDGLV